MYSFFSPPASPTPEPICTEKEALEAIDEIGPRMFTVLINDSDVLRIDAIGCAGEHGVRQHQVAKEMDAHAKDDPAHLLLLLGDNAYPKRFYHGAITSATDPRINDVFYDVYHTDKTPHLKGKPAVVVLGNHDANLERIADMYNRYILKSYPQGKEAEKYQVAHTYTRKQKDFYAQENFQLKDMPPWNLPYYYSGYRFPRQKTTLFCLNSNTYVKDFIESWKNADGDTQTMNQSVWFDKHFFDAKREGHTTLVAMHNPLKTVSKRSEERKYDAFLYPTPEQVKQMNYIMRELNDPAKFPNGIPDNSRDDFESYIRMLALLKTVFQKSDPAINALVETMPDNGSYADMIDTCFKIQNIKSDVHLCAHDHMLLHYVDGRVCQVTSGAGGSTSLMDKVTNKYDDHIGCYLSEPGFTSLTCHPGGKVEVEFQTINGHRVVCNNQSAIPIESNYPEATPAHAKKAATEAAPGFSISRP